MNEFTMTQSSERKFIIDKSIGSVMMGGLFIRLALLLIILFFFSDTNDLYLVSDDIAYEGIAASYLANANKIIDYDCFRMIGAQGYLQTFFPWVECVSAYLFKSIYAARFINVLLSTYNILLIYRIVLLLTDRKESAILASKLMAYLPTLIIFCCFPLKDTYICTATFFTFETMLTYQEDKSLSIPRIIINALLLYTLYYTRGGITELLLAFFFTLLLIDSFKGKKYFRTFIIGVIIAFLSIRFGDEVIAVFSRKLNDYFFTDYARGSDTTIALVRIDSISQIWKLPFTYFFALLNPFTLNIFTKGSSSLFAYLQSALNVVIYPIAISNMIYIFKRKTNLYFWLSTFITFVGVIILSLGISRHYFFLMPVEIINYVLYKENATKLDRQIVSLGSLLLFILVLTISFIRI